MFGFIKKEFLVLLSFGGSLATKCISLDNKPYIIRPTLIDLNPDECNQRWCHYSFAVSLGRCSGSCNTLDDSSIRISASNKTEDVNLNVFNMFIKTCFVWF